MSVRSYHTRIRDTKYIYIYILLHFLAFEDNRMFFHRGSEDIGRIWEHADVPRSNVDLFLQSSTYMFKKNNFWPCSQKLFNKFRLCPLDCFWISASISPWNDVYSPDFVYLTTEAEERQNKTTFLSSRKKIHFPKHRWPTFVFLLKGHRIQKKNLKKKKHKENIVEGKIYVRYVTSAISLDSTLSNTQLWVKAFDKLTSGLRLRNLWLCIFWSEN